MSMRTVLTIATAATIALACAASISRGQGRGGGGFTQPEPIAFDDHDYLEPGQWTDETLALVEERLAETPCHAALSYDRVIFPNRKAPEALRAKWLANKPTNGGKIVVH